MRKFQDIIKGDDYISVREKFRDLFLNLWKDKLNMVDGISVGFFDDPNEWEFVCDIYAEFNDYTYKYFKQIFDIIEKLDLKFSFIKGRLKVYMKTKCNEFINEMEILSNVKKYNV